MKKESAKNSTLVTSKGETFKFIDDFFFWSGFDDGDYKNEDLIFGGYGIEDDKYSDYKDLDVKDKWVVVYDGEPTKDGKSLISGKNRMSKWSEDWKLKRDVASEKGAKGVLIVKTDYNNYLSRVKYWLENPGLRLDYDQKRGEEVIPVLFVREEVAKSFLNKKKIAKWKSGKSKGKPIVASGAQINIVKEKEEIISENVLCFIEGTDPELKNEVVVITAHYDHIGIQKGRDK